MSFNTKLYHYTSIWRFFTISILFWSHKFRHRKIFFKLYYQQFDINIWVYMAGYLIYKWYEHWKIVQNTYNKFHHFCHFLSFAEYTRETKNSVLENSKAIQYYYTFYRNVLIVRKLFFFFVAFLSINRNTLLLYTRRKHTYFTHTHSVSRYINYRQDNVIFLFRF